MKERGRVAEGIKENKKVTRSSRISRADSSQPSSSLSDRVLFLQRTIGNQGVERLIRSGTHELTYFVQQMDGSSLMQGGPGGLAGVAVQRKNGDKGNAMPAVDAKTPVPTPTSAADAKDKGNTTPITFTSIAEDIAGIGKDRVKGKEGDDALWFSPLNVHSDTPLTKYSKKSFGVLAGSGAQQIDTFHAPLTEGDSPHGSGTVTARLKYADSAAKSFNVTVAGTKNIRAAEKAARSFIEEKITEFGDVDELQTDTATYLETKGFANATVEIKMRANKTKDVGETSFFYLARSKPQILMRISTAKVGEKKTTSSGSTTTSKDTGTESETHHEGSKETVDIKDTRTKEEKHKESSTETVDVDYNKLVVKTLNEKVKKVETVRSELISKLTDVIVDTEDYTKKEDIKTKYIPGTYENYTKNVKGYSEEGDKEKSNWASKGRKAIGVVKDVISIPFIDKIPKIGRIIRKIRGGWALDLIDTVLGAFAEEGTVHFTNSTDTTTIRKEKGGEDTTTTTGEVVIKSGSKSDQKRDLKETIKKNSKSDWSRYKEEIENTMSKYRSVTKKDSAGGSESKEEDTYKYGQQKKSEGGSDRKTESEHKSTTATFTTSTTWVISKPVVEAAVVGGDGEVSSVPFREPSKAASMK